MSRHLAHNILRHLEPWRYCSFDFAHRSRHFVSSGYHHATYKPQLFFHPAVKDALESGAPVVALESTIITHGMPYPANRDTALAVEKVIKDNGAVPATIAILDGRIHVGLGEGEIEKLAKTGKAARKTSRRDLALVVSQRGTGATTVSGTMVIAGMAGIRVFVTGGIGGVHRGGQSSMDVSADLTELGRTPVAVVCAGVKSILDIPRTLEYLETQGVTTVTLGPSDDFPAFFCRSSGSKSMVAMATARDCAELVHANVELGLSSGMVIAVPIPKEHAQDSDKYNKIIEEALEEADAKGIHGAAVTPFMLQRVNELTGGNSLASNIALVMNNAQKGAEIAVELSRLRTHSAGPESSQTKAGSSTSSAMGMPSGAEGWKNVVASRRPVVVGGALADFVAKATEGTHLVAHTSNPGYVNISFGGVARNVAECMARLGCSPQLVSVRGDDVLGEALISDCRAFQLSTDDIMLTTSAGTAVYTALCQSSGELEMAVVDVAALDELTPARLEHYTDAIKSAPIVVVDGNVRPDTFQYLVNLCRSGGVPVWFEPTSLAKSTLPLRTNCIESLTYISPDRYELQHLSQEVCALKLSDGTYGSEWGAHVRSRLSSYPDDAIREPLIHALEVAQCVPNVVAKLGADGAMLVQRRGTAKPYEIDSTTLQYAATWFPARHPDFPSPAIVNVNGAGDSLVGAMCAAIAADIPAVDALARGMAAARLSVQSARAVSPKITTQKMSAAAIASSVPPPTVLKISGLLR